MPYIITRKFNTLISEIEAKGVGRVARVLGDRLIIAILAKMFRFPASWHPPTSMRPYRIAVAKVVSDLHPKIVCEVGCGLGSILTRVNAPRRIGYDISAGVIRAARLIRPGSIEFKQGGLDAVRIPSMDVLILVNWIHEVSPKDLESSLLPLLPRTHYLMLDAIDPDNAFGYRYKHDFAFLVTHAVRRSTTRVEGEGRSFILYEVL